MTWLGKILAVMVLLLSLVWVWLTAVTFATRTNWKAQYDEAKRSLEKSESYRAEETARANNRIADLEKKLADERSRNDTHSAQNVSLNKALVLNSADYASLDIRFNESDPKAVVQASNLQAALNEQDSLRKRNAALEDEGKDLRITRERALNEKAAAEADARQARAISEEFQKRNDFLAAELQDLRARGASGGGIAGLQLDRRPAAPLYEGTRGEVTGYQDGLVVLSIGLDAGVNPRSVLEISRLGGGGKYLGTVVVTDAYPKYSVASFRPVSGKPLNRLAADELPRIGDRVDAPKGRPGG